MMAIGLVKRSASMPPHIAAWIRSHTAITSGEIITSSVALLVAACQAMICWEKHRDEGYLGNTAKFAHT
jgi:hypothetical protein